MADWTYDELTAGREKARAAGDEKAVRLFNQKLEATPQYALEWRSNAAKDGNREAAEAITKRYYKTRAKDGYIGGDLKTDPVFQADSRELYEQIHGEPFEGADEEAGEFGLNFRRDLDTTDVGLFQQLKRAHDGEVDDGMRSVLRRVDAGYEQADMSLSGLGAHALNLLNPLESPSTYVGGVFGGLAAKGAAKAGGKAVTKKLMQRAATDEGKKLASTAGQELAEQGVRTAGQRMRRGAAAGSAEGAVYGAAHDAGMQSFQNEDGEYDPTRGLRAATGGAVAGGALGAVVGPLLGRDGKAIRQAGDMVEGVDAVPSGAAERVMRQVLEQGTDNENLLNRANSGDLSGAYRDYVAEKGQLSPEELIDVFENAGNEALRDYGTILKETRKLGQQHGIGERLILEAADARKAAKKGGVTPNTIGSRLTDNPNFRQMPKEARERMMGNIRQMQNAVQQASDITDFANKTFGKQGAAEQILSMPEVNVALDQLPRGYVLSRAAGRSLGVMRRRSVPKRFHQQMGNVSKLNEDMAPGLDSRARVRRALDNRGVVDEVGEWADQSDINLGAGKWSGKKPKLSPEMSARVKARADMKKAYKKDQKTHDSVRAMGVSNTTDHGGIVGEMAVRHRIDKPHAIRELNKMWTEAKKAESEATDVLNQARLDGADADELRELVNQRKAKATRRKLIERFQKKYADNVHTGRMLTGDKASSEKVYYRIADELADRLRRKGSLMSDGAYYKYLRREGYNDKQIKDLVGEDDFIDRAKAQLKAERNRNKNAGKTKARHKEEEETFKQARREKRARDLSEEQEEVMRSHQAWQERQKPTVRPGTSAAEVPPRPDVLEGEYIQRVRPMQPAGDRGPIEGESERIITGAPPWEQQAQQFGDPPLRLARLKKALASKR